MRSDMNGQLDRFLDTIRVRRVVVGLAALACCLMVAAGARAATITESELKARVEAATKDLKDISMVGTVAEVDKKAMEKMDADYTRLLELKSAKMSLKLPDKMKIEGKLGMVKFEYIINGTTKITRAPAVRFKRKDDYSNSPAKLQGPFDIGIVTGTLWRNRKVTVVDDPEAAKNDEIKLELRWPTGDMVHYAWLDAQNLWLKRVEKRDGQGNLKVRTVYSNPKNLGGSVWMPTTVELFSPEGGRVGKTQMSDIKYNMGLQDTLFQ